MAASQQQANNDMDCLEMWKDELRQTQNILVKAEAEAQQACATYETIVSVKNKLNIYLDNIDATAFIISKIQDELAVFLSQINDACEKTECTVEAMKVLYCFIKEFFECTDTFSTTISGFITQIECLNLSGKPSIVLKCLQTLTEKLNVTIATQEAMIKLIIEIVQDAIEIDKLICNSTCGSLQSLVFALIKKHRSIAARKRDKDILLTFKSEPNTKTQFMSGLEGLNLIVQFPITDEPTRMNLSDAVNAIDGVCEEAKEECDKQRQEADIVRACKQSLENAIAAATEAKACK